jgi:hypothetical protein
VEHLQHFHSTSRRCHCILELKDFFSTNGDFADVMHASNSTDINPHSVIIRRHGNHEPEFINILSRHYEPLHYVLLFLHGDAGWVSEFMPEGQIRKEGLGLSSCAVPLTRVRAPYFGMKSGGHPTKFGGTPKVRQLWWKYPMDFRKCGKVRTAGTRPEVYLERGN